MRIAVQEIWSLQNHLNSIHKLGFWLKIREQYLFCSGIADYYSPWVDSIGNANSIWHGFSVFWYANLCAIAYALQDQTETSYAQSRRILQFLNPKIVKSNCQILQGRLSLLQSQVNFPITLYIQMFQQYYGQKVFWGLKIKAVTAMFDTSRERNANFAFCMLTYLISG